MLALRWSIVASGIAAPAGARLHVWASIRFEGDVAPRVRLSSIHSGEPSDGPESVLRPPGGAGDQYCRALLATVEVPPDASLELQAWAGADAGSGAVWWDALWLEPEQAGLPIGTVLPTDDDRRERTDPPLPLTPPPLPSSAPPLPGAGVAAPRPAERRTAERRRIAGIPAGVAIIVLVILVAGAIGGVALTGGKKAAKPTAGGFLSPSPTASPIPSPSPSADPLTTARLAGDWTATFTITKRSGYFSDGMQNGEKFVRAYTFMPGCPSGPCSGTLRRQSGQGTLTDAYTYADGVYRWSRTDVSDCFTTSGVLKARRAYTRTYTFEIRMTRATGGEATEFRGVYTGTLTPNATGRSADCRPTSDGGTILGVPRGASPP